MWSLLFEMLFYRKVSHSGIDQDLESGGIKLDHSSSVEIGNNNPE